MANHAKSTVFLWYNGDAEDAARFCAEMKAMTGPDRAAAKRAFEAMMQMTKIDVATIEAARRG